MVIMKMFSKVLVLSAAGAAVLAGAVIISAIVLVYGQQPETIWEDGSKGENTTNMLLTKIFAILVDIKKQLTELTALQQAHGQIADMSTENFTDTQEQEEEEEEEEEPLPTLVEEDNSTTTAGTVEPPPPVPECGVNEWFDQFCQNENFYVPKVKGECKQYFIYVPKIAQCVDKEIFYDYDELDSRCVKQTNIICSYDGTIYPICDPKKSMKVTCYNDESNVLCSPDLARHECELSFQEEELTNEEAEGVEKQQQEFDQQAAPEPEQTLEDATIIVQNDALIFNGTTANVTIIPEDNIVIMTTTTNALADIFEFKTPLENVSTEGKVGDLWGRE
jgi:hypothetical protein